MLPSAVDLHAFFPNGIDFSNPRHQCFQNVQVTSFDPVTGDEIETFEFHRRGNVFDDGSGPLPASDLMGPVTTVVTRNGGSHDREPVQTRKSSPCPSSAISAVVSIDIRESPTKTSPGRRSVFTDIGVGSLPDRQLLRCVHRTVDRRGAFQPQTNPGGRMDLVPVNPDECQCVPDVVACDLSDPLTCGGECPIAGDLCTPDPAGGPLFLRDSSGGV